jgi:hypothetical protein
MRDAPRKIKTIAARVGRVPAEETVTYTGRTIMLSIMLAIMAHDHGPDRVDEASPIKATAPPLIDALMKRTIMRYSKHRIRATYDHAL